MCVCFIDLSAFVSGCVLPCTSAIPCYAVLSHPRHFDWYLGHSWASGIVTSPNGKNQESTSEVCAKLSEPEAA